MNTEAFPNPFSIFFVLAALSVLPFMALMVTSFLKIVVVLHLTRSALGVQESPPATVINGLAIILSVFIMAPVGNAAMKAAQAEMDKPATTIDSMFRIANAAKPPFVEFLQRHAHEREKQFFMKSAQRMWPPEMTEGLASDHLFVLVPSFTLSELKTAFQIGFVIYLAFIVVDFIVATVLLALGMSMISPTVVSVPFKLLLFVMLDGWSLLIHNLVATYR